MASGKRLGLAAFRTGIRALGVVAPGTVERLIIRRFGTPVRFSTNGSAPVGEQWTVKSNGADVAVYSAGEGPRVLLVHGWEGTAGDFTSLAAFLRGNGFGVVAFDQPAHGRSPGKRTHLIAMRQAVLDVARATGPFAAVVGHSLGASATLLALRDGLAARKAVLIAPPRDARYFVRLLGGAMGASRARVEGAVARLEREFPVAIGGTATDLVASELSVPGLVMHDREDRAVPFSHGAAIAASWPGARFLPLEGMGHRRVLDTPAVQDEILRFIR